MERVYRIRSLRDGQWYWVATTVVQRMAKKIGFLAFAVYSFLASMADKNQSCFPSQSYIAKCLGCSRSSVGRAMNALKSYGLISVEKGGSSNQYMLLSAESGMDDTSKKLGTPLDVSRKTSRSAHRCDTNYLRISKSDTRVRHLKKDQKQNPSKGESSSSVELLAKDLASELGEPEKYEVYLSLAETYPEHFLREMLSRVQQTPRHKIRKNRAAFFMFLVNQHGKRHFDHFGG